MSTTKKSFLRKVSFSLVFLFTFLILFGAVTVNRASAQASGTAAAAKEISSNQAEVSKFGLIAAAIAFGFGAIGAGIAIANVGAAAMGAIGEKPEIASQALIFIALAEGLVVFGFIAALMILGKF
jgi:V/A-type H+/Na+-transporting ATPase subunit K